SVEHDVSIVTAHQVMAVLSARHRVVPVYVTREGRWLSAPGLNDLEVYRKGRWEEAGEEAFIPPVAGYGGLMVPGGRLRGARRVPVDVALPAIHGTFGEDGTLQGLLELADIPYPGPTQMGAAVAMDKVMMKAAFAAAGLPVVGHHLVDADKLQADRQAVVDELERAIGYPAFVKPARLGSSVGIGKARDRDGLLEALDVARRYDRKLLVEPSMEDCIEVNCSVLGGPGVEPEVSVCEQPMGWTEFQSFSDKYIRAGKSGAAKAEGMAGQDRRIPAPLPDELTKQIQDNALRAFRAVDGSGVARVDSFVKAETNETWLMEINTIPGSFSFYLWEPSGVAFEELVERLIEIALRAHELRGELMFSFDSQMLEQFGGAKGG
ncbi:MAG: D-alanine--D-alanine ligase family protein, partial [Actinomycetota bacterium]